MGLGVQVNGPLRKRYFKTFPVESLEDSLSEFMLSQILIGEFPHMTDEREIERRLAKARDEPYRWGRVGQQSRYLAERRRGLF